MHPAKNEPQTTRMVGPNPGLGARQEKPLEATVPESPYHNGLV